MSGEATRFRPGQVANPRGRPKGSRRKLSERFLADLATDFEENGLEALRQARAEDPAAYCRIVASLLPKQSEKLPNPLSEFTDDELRRLDELLAAIPDPPTNSSGSGEAG
jgi:Family of unknown function (DUF5681)